MTIYFKPAKDSNSPASLAIKADRLDDKDKIVLSECLWSLTDVKISIIGFLSEDSIGVQDYNDKQFKPCGQKIAFSFSRDEFSAYNKDSQKYEVEATSLEQKLQFKLLHAAITKLQIEQKAVCASASLQPNVTPLMTANADSTDPDAQSYFRVVTKDMFVFSPREPDKLTGEDTDFINTLASAKPGEYTKKSGGWNSGPKESESERLSARWDFIKTQFDDVLELKVTSLPALLEFIEVQGEPYKTVYKTALNLLLQLVSK